MEALRETTSRAYTVRVPKKDAAIFRSMTSRMGWTITPQPRKRKTEAHIPNATTIRAIMDVKAGKVFHAKSAEDLIAQLND